MLAVKNSTNQHAASGSGANNAVSESEEPSVESAWVIPSIDLVNDVALYHAAKRRLEPVNEMLTALRN